MILSSRTNFLELTAATCTKCTWIRGSHFFHPTHASWTEHEDNAYKVSNTSSMFNMNHGGDKMLLMGSTTTHQNFHITGIPPLCEQGDSIGQTKRYNGVCSRKTTSKTTLLILLVLIWFDDSSYSNQRLDKIIGPATDHRDQSMKISSFFNTHTTQGYPLRNELGGKSFHLPTLQVVV